MQVRDSFSGRLDSFWCLIACALPFHCCEVLQHAKNQLFSSGVAAGTFQTKSLVPSLLFFLETPSSLAKLHQLLRPSDSVISERQLLSGVQNVPQIVPWCCTATYGSPQFTCCQFHLSNAVRWLMARRQGHSVLPLPKGCYILVCMVVRVHLTDKSTFKSSSPTGIIFQVNFSSCVTLSPWLWQPSLLDFS